MSRTATTYLTALTLCLGLIATPAAFAETRIEKSFDLAPGGRLEVDTDVGSITVTGTSGSGASVIITSTRDDLEDELEISFDGGGDQLLIKAEKRKKNWRGWSFKGKVHYEIEVPHQTELNLDTSGGAIEVSSTEGDALLDTSGGPIRVRDVRGEVEADTSGGPITIEDVEGDVLADTSGGGIRIERVQGNVSADTSGGGIKIYGVSGDLEADTSGGGIDIRDAEGRVHADTSGGSIEVVFASGNSRGGSLSTSGGGIRVAVDASANLEIDAAASGGPVRSDLPITIQGEFSKSTLNGTLNGGGDRLKLRTSGGGIRIESN